MTERDVILDDSEYEQPMDEEMEKEFKYLDKMLERADEKNMYINMYKRFSNFPSNIKKDITFQACVIAAAWLLFLVSVIWLHYFSAVLLVALVGINVYMGLRIWTTFFYLKNAYFVTFTGKITESNPIGSKLTNNKHYILKLTNDESGKEMCFHYYGSQNLQYGQEMTLFLRHDATINPTSYGPMAESYIEAVLTDEIEAYKNRDNDNSARHYIDED